MEFCQPECTTIDADTARCVKCESLAVEPTHETTICEKTSRFGEPLYLAVCSCGIRGAAYHSEVWRAHQGLRYAHEGAAARVTFPFERAVTA